MILIGLGIGLILGAIARFEVNYNRIDSNKGCRHCGQNEGNYCEKCFQDLVAQNARLQLKTKTLESIRQNEKEIKNE